MRGAGRCRVIVPRGFSEYFGNRFAQRLLFHRLAEVRQYGGRRRASLRLAIRLGFGRRLDEVGLWPDEVGRHSPPIVSYLSGCIIILAHQCEVFVSL